MLLTLDLLAAKRLPRTVLPCLDDPALKATFNVTVTAPQGLTLLANTPAAGAATAAVGADGLNATVVAFQPSPVMSAYQLALAVGYLVATNATSSSR